MGECSITSAGAVEIIMITADNGLSAHAMPRCDQPMTSDFEAARRIRSRFPDCAMVILSSHKDEQFIAERTSSVAPSVAR
jgi:hypothetical protein